MDARGVLSEVSALDAVDVEAFESHAVRAHAHDASLPRADESRPTLAHEVNGPVEDEIACEGPRADDDRVSRCRPVHAGLKRGRLLRGRPPFEPSRRHRRHVAGDLQEDDEGQRDHDAPAVACADARRPSRQARAIATTRTTATRPSAYDPTPGYE